MKDNAIALLNRLIDNFTLEPNEHDGYNPDEVIPGVVNEEGVKRIFDISANSIRGGLREVQKMV